MLERLQKIISTAGIASRRKAEELIISGKVEVDGKIITELGFKADIKLNKIKVNGRLLKSEPEKIYLALNKPIGVVSTRKDEKGRTTVIDLINTSEYIYPVGRLDIDSTGLILITNDGDIAQALLHPKNEIPKTYLVEVEGYISEDELGRFRKGVIIDGEKTAPAKARILSTDKGKTRLEVIIHEGKNRQIRKMFSVIGYDVIRLKRIRIGEIILDSLESGDYRKLTSNEIAWLLSISKES